MKKGVLLALSIYFVGFGLAWLIYLILGHPYIHAPGFHHFIIFLTFTISLFWTLVSLIYFFFKKKSQEKKAFIITNLVLIFCFIIYLFSIFKEEKLSKDEFIKKPKNEVIMKSKGDSIVGYLNGKIIYLSIKDSVITDSIKSIKIDALHIK